MTPLEELAKLPVHLRYKRLWADSGLEQQPFADLVGINRTSFSKIANGNLDPGPVLAERMAAYTGYPAGLFYDGRKTATEARTRRIVREELADLGPLPVVLEQLGASAGSLAAAADRLTEVVGRLEQAAAGLDARSSS